MDRATWRFVGYTSAIVLALVESALKISHVKMTNYILLAIVFVVAVLSIWIKIDDNELRRHYEQFGWYVNTSGGAEESVICYIERDHMVSVSGDRNGPVFVPTAENWVVQAPEFAKHRREEILGRMRAECRNTDFVESADAELWPSGFRRDWDKFGRKKKR